MEAGVMVESHMLRAGASKIEITPTSKVFLAGLSGNRLSTGIHDDLWARCLALSDGNQILVLTSLDLIGLFLDDVNEIRKETAKHVSKSRNINVLVACTHQHSGPDTLGLWGPDPSRTGVDERYMTYLKKRVVKVILNALKNMRAATIRFASAEIPKGIAKNTRDPGLLDREISIMGVEDRNGDVIAFLLNFALHPEVLWSDNTLITADFPNYLYKAVEDEMGGVAIFFNGDLGGMVTPDVEAHTFSEAERIGKVLAEESIRAYYEDGFTTDMTDIRLVIKCKDLRLPVENELFIRLSRMGVLRRKVTEDMVLTEISHVSIGCSEFVTIPGEPLPKIGLKIKRLMDGRFRFLVGLANDEIGYIIPEDDWNPGRYEESMSLGPKTGTLILSGLTEVIRP
ncbi:hypothetical protein CW702_01220 [Candidatus Bathyarchaeota archaeon]|nr:MAG: hypothetical protein CW702_01220 [Candidatus Bathyarchaeota archaeon]